MDPRKLLPRTKHEVDRARAVTALGYPAVAPVLRDLLQWLQDCNWPVSRPIEEFLVTIPEPVAPLIWEVLRGDDLIWKYWCIHRLVSRMPPPIATQFRDELTRLATQPTPKERGEELNDVAQAALVALWPDAK